MKKIPALFRMISAAGGVEMTAAQAGDAITLKRFSMVAYTGGAMALGGWPYPVVVNLDGLTVTKKPRPILRDHDAGRVVGHTEAVEVAGGKLRAEGVISGTGADAREITDSAANGFPWQASIGARAVKVKMLEEGQTAQVNGKEISGPAYIVQKSALGEISFVALGADDNTSATVAAGAAGCDFVEAEISAMEKGDAMLSEWLKAKGFDLEKLTEQQKTSLQAQYDAEQVKAAAPAAPVAGVTLEQVRAESARIAAIQAACASQPEIAGKAISEGWSVEKAELHALKATSTRNAQDSKVGSPAVIVGKADVDADTLKAAVCMGAKVPEKQLLAAYGEKACNAAGKYRRAGIRALMATSMQIDGARVPALTASAEEWARAAFSSATFTDLLSDSANKVLLAAYNAVPSVARVIARSLSTADFKINKGVRLTGDLVMKKVDAGGEITHGSLGDDSYSYSVDTFGRMIGLTRQDIINDDLGAFMQLPQMFGRGAALAIEQAFWTLVIANTGSFFSGANGNYIATATSNLSIAGLTEGEKALEEQTDQDGNPVLVRGRYLVVPPALTGTAQQLYTSTAIIAGTATAAQGNANIHAGKYEPLSTPYLKAAAKVWYLFGDPSDVAAFGIAYLNGVETPTIEEVTPSAEYLGRAWRGYVDFGVCQIDKRGALKSKGEA